VGLWLVLPLGVTDGVSLLDAVTLLVDDRLVDTEALAVGV
jgi:hypothetical protein